jgi:hypothetical protein
MPTSSFEVQDFDIEEDRSLLSGKFKNSWVPTIKHDMGSIIKFTVSKLTVIAPKNSVILAMFCQLCNFLSISCVRSLLK